MLTLLVDIEDTATPSLKSLLARMADKRSANAAAAASMMIPIKQNFLKLSGSNHNAFGVKSTFWGLMNAGTVAGADDSDGWVSMPRPVALRYFGGTVYPGAGKKRLAIPARSEAYGKSPRDFSDLRLAVLGRGSNGQLTLGLVQAEQQKIKYGRKRKDGTRKIIPGDVAGGGVFFFLVPSATIRPDPTVLPTPDVLRAAGINGVRGYLSHVRRTSS